MVDGEVERGFDYATEVLQVVGITLTGMTLGDAIGEIVGYPAIYAASGGLTAYWLAYRRFAERRRVSQRQDTEENYDEGPE